MHIDFFENQITRLKDSFGEKFFSEERKKMIWNWTKDLYQNELDKIVSYFISESKLPPLPVNFKEAASKEKKLRPIKIIKVPFHIDCKLCFDIGIHQIKNKIDKFQTLVICDCNHGDTVSNNLKRWEYSMNGEWEKLPLDPSEFTPDTNKNEKLDSHKTRSSIKNKARFWKARIHVAEQVWLDT